MAGERAEIALGPITATADAVSVPVLDPPESPELPRGFRALLLTEGSYPFLFGGVSTWAHTLIGSLSEVQFHVMALSADPALDSRFELPPNVVEFRPTPLWGLTDPLEMGDNIGFGELRRRRRRATGVALGTRFAPLLRDFVTTVFAPERAFKGDEQARLIHLIHVFFLEHDFASTMRSPAAWQAFHETAGPQLDQLARSHGYDAGAPTLEELMTIYDWLRHWLAPLARPLPRVDVVHAAMPGVCTLIAAAAMGESRSALLLTEHGVYLREVYLAEAATDASIVLKLAKLAFARRMTQLGYDLAAHIAPCCDFNQRWETRQGADPDKLETISYGVDPAVFTPTPRSLEEDPVVVWMGRINPLKDVETLVRAAAVVHAARPEVRFKCFGTPPPEDAAYFQQCLALRSALGLDDCMTFPGFAARPQDAFNEADLVVLTSISEGSPFSTIEAMLCGKPIVATAVGGVPEQIEGCGLTVEPRNPEQFGEAILTMLRDPIECRRLGRVARERAERLFSTERSRRRHIDAYFSVTQQLHNRSFNGSLPNFGPLALAPHVHTNHANGTVLDIRHPHQPVIELASGDGHADRDDEFVAQQQGLVAPHQGLVAQQQGLRPVYSAIAVLAMEVRQQVPLLVDAFEVAAVVESLGITDETARSRYGESDVFSLAERVFHMAKRHNARQRHSRRERSRSTVPPEQRRDGRFEGFELLTATAALITIIQLAGRWGDFHVAQLTALGVGLSGAVVVTNGLIYGLNRRLAIFLGVGRPVGAWHAIRGPLVLAETLIIIAAAVGAALSTALGAGTDTTAAMSAGFAGLGVIWLLEAVASGLSSKFRAGSHFVIAVLALVAVDRALVDSTSAHFAIASAAGWLVAFSLGVWSTLRALRALGVGRHMSAPIPSRSYRLLEGLPYFAYGLASTVLIFSPHVTMLLGTWWRVDDWSRPFVAAELGLTIGLLPVAAVGGAAKKAIYEFWLEALATQKVLAIDAREELGLRMRAFRAREVRALAWRLALTIGLAVLITELLLSLDVLGSGPDADVGMLRLGLGASCIASVAVAFGALNGSFCLTLGRVELMRWPLAAALLVTIGAGIPLAMFVSYRAAPVAYVAGAVIFAAASERPARALLDNTDRALSTAL